MCLLPMRLGYQKMELPSLYLLMYLVKILMNQVNIICYKYIYWQMESLWLSCANHVIYHTVRVAFFLYENTSYLLAPEDNTTKIISPVISATTNCTSCPVTDFEQDILIEFDLHVRELDTMKREIDISFIIYICFF